MNAVSTPQGAPEDLVYARERTLGAITLVLAILVWVALIVGTVLDLHQRRAPQTGPAPTVLSGSDALARALGWRTQFFRCASSHSNTA